MLILLILLLTLQLILLLNIPQPPLDVKYLSKFNYCLILSVPSSFPPRHPRGSQRPKEYGTYSLYCHFDLRGEILRLQPLLLSDPPTSLSPINTFGIFFIHLKPPKSQQTEKNFLNLIYKTHINIFLSIYNNIFSSFACAQDDNVVPAHPPIIETLPTLSS
jgi:hypothetical protein